MGKFTQFIVIIAALWGLSSCTTVYEQCLGYESDTDEYKQCAYDAREYARVEYLETTFKPSLAACKQAGGIEFWRRSGAQSFRMRQAIKRGTYDGLTRMELRQFTCCVDRVANCIDSM